MKRILILMFLPLTVQAVDHGAVTREKYPDANTVCIEEIESVAYNADGTSQTETEAWTKILTEKGRREESTITLNYSKRYGEAAIVYVGAIGTNGIERAIDISKTVSETTDNSSMSSNIYDPLDRRIVCTVPGLAVGEVVHVKMRRKTSKSRVRDHWSDISVMEWTHPILKSTYKVKSPASRPVKTSAVRHPLGNISQKVERFADGSMLHTYVATNSPQMFPEPDMPPVWTQVQHVRLSTLGSWQELSKWYWDLCLPHLSRTNEAMTNKVAELGRDMHSIFKFVSQEIRYMGLTLEDTSPGYAPHDVDITFNNRYGVCRDKAALLVAMLRMAGIKAFPVLINVGAKMDEEVPQPFFNHAVVAVEKDDGSYVLMDPTDENTKDLFPSYLSDKSYLVCRPEGDKLRTSPVPKASDNGVDVESSGRLSKDGVLVLENKILFKGINDTAYRGAFAKRTAEERIKTFERIVKRVAPGAELVSCEIMPRDMRDTRKPLKAKLISRIPQAVLEGVTKDELFVPMVSKQLGVVNWILDGSTSLVERKYPLVIDTTAEVRESVKLEIADAFGKPLSLPDPLKVEGGYQYRSSCLLSNGVLRIGRQVSLAKVEFNPGEYADLREELKRIEAAERRRPVFAKNRLSDAHVRYILSSSETTVFSDSEWVTTNTVVKEVLDYAGKKQSSELKFHFNALWKDVEIVSAVVSNSDGRVSVVTPREINIMDDGWVASSPRYPASKLLVVNLPSVEIGSVISVTSVTKVRNAPESFYASYVFDTHEPLDRKVVRVNGWRRELVSPSRLAREPNQPGAEYWRDQVVVSSNDWERTVARFASSAFDAKIDADVADEVVFSAIPQTDSRAESVRAVRDWMAKNVKVAGPSLYELPLESQLTAPEQVVKERYATRLDYVRTMCALLRHAGFDAGVVLSRMNASSPQWLRNRDIAEKPNVRAFSSALCRVEVPDGSGWLGLGGKKTILFIGTENQYSQIGASAYSGSDFFDPMSGEFGVVQVPDANLESYEHERSQMTVHEDGAVDFVVENELGGVAVGAFRKTYSEILPEDRFRRYQEILGAVAQAAVATSELECDVDSYPAKRRFSCHVPQYAAVEGDTITLQLPDMINSLPSMTGIVRHTPFAVAQCSASVDSVVVRFPKGYTQIEHLPREFSFADPANPDRTWLVNKVSWEIKDDRLEVTVMREVPRRPFTCCDAGFFALVRDWRRIAESRDSHTISVRKSR